MNLVANIRRGIDQKIADDTARNITNRTYYLGDIRPYLSDRDREMLRVLPGFRDARAISNLHVHGAHGVRNDNLARIENNY